MAGIILLDSGVSNSIYENEIQTLYTRGKTRVIKKKFIKRTSKTHADVCIDIIKNYCSSARVCLMEVLEEESHRCKIEILINALQQCLVLDDRIIHMSIGSVRQKDFNGINGIVDQLFNAGKIIVAACSNKNIYTSPACLQKVIGVAGARYLQKADYIYRSEQIDGINFLAAGSHIIEAGMTQYANSYAAPVITAHVSRILDSNPNADFYDVMESLIRGAKETDRSKFIVARKTIDIPLVVCKGITKNIVKRIYNYFIGAGYSCLGFSEQNEAELSDFIKLDGFSCNKCREYLEIYFSIYHPDILLLYANENIFIEEESYIDIIDIIVAPQVSDKYDSIKDLYYINGDGNAEETFRKIVLVLTNDKGSDSNNQDDCYSGKKIPK